MGKRVVKVVTPEEFEQAKRLIGKSFSVRIKDKYSNLYVTCVSVEIKYNNVWYICKSKGGHTIGLFRNEFEVLA